MDIPLGKQIKDFIIEVEGSTKLKKTTTTSQNHRKHNHFPMGKTGFDPKLARLNHHDKPGKKKK